MTVVAFILLNR